MNQVVVTITSKDGIVTKKVLSKGKGGIPKLQLPEGATLAVEVIPQIQDQANADSGSAQETGELHQVQLGSDLVIQANGETLFEVSDFYTTPDVSLQSVAWDFEGMNLAQAPAQATTTLEGQAAQSAAQPATTGAAEAASAGAEAAAGAAETGGFVGVGMAPLALGVGAAAVLAGKSSSSSSTTTNTVEGSVVAGPVSGGLSVTAYSAAGTSLGTATVDSDGTFKVDVGSYTGPVYLKVADTNGDAANYTSEASAAATDLNVTLLAVGNVGSGATTLHITPLTTIAARKAGVTDAGALTGTLNATTVSNANTGVAKAFGLSGVDITTTKPVTTVESSTPNDYGRVLAAIEGAGGE